MSINPFGTPKNYSDMLNKIMVFNFFGCLVLTGLAAWVEPGVSHALDSFRLPVKISPLGIEGIPVSYLIPALAFSFIARIIKLHDRISDIFHIRRAFELNEILVPLAGGVGVPTTLALLQKMRDQRRSLMNRVFFAYASSTQPKIDSHLITMALDRWLWFWVLIEVLAAAMGTYVFFLAFGQYRAAAWLGLGILIGTLCATFVNRVCAGIAHLQVEAILSNNSHKREVQGALHAL